MPGWLAFFQEGGDSLGGFFRCPPRSNTVRRFLNDILIYRLAGDRINQVLGIGHGTRRILDKLVQHLVPCLRQMMDVLNNLMQQTESMALPLSENTGGRRARQSLRPHRERSQRAAVRA